MTTPNNERLTAALDYAARGLAVFPLAPKGKIPYRGTNGLKDATTDEATIRAWWEKYPSANIGLPVPPGCVIVDLDKGVDFESLDRLLPSTRIAQTGGGGLHYWFRLTDQSNLNCKPFPHVDLRLAGKHYVVAPPSETAGDYFWYGEATDTIADMPPDLLERLQRPDSSPEPAQAASTGASPPDWLQRALGKARADNRNLVGLWLACQLDDNGYSEPDALEVMARYVSGVPTGNHPYTEKEARATLSWAYHVRIKRPPARSQRSRDPENGSIDTPSAPLNSVINERMNEGMKERTNEDPQ